MNWLLQNWIWVLLIGGIAAINSFRYGERHRGLAGHGERRQRGGCGSGSRDKSHRASDGDAPDHLAGA
ncbi:MAG: hypothetical protein GC186_20125 [Rhodobacteraceae bacterium]|nr:hypothetical protein [Paracoccaceae bacterium]